ncbi:YwqH-like family protein [Halobacillus hunanensis]|uniref:YwqH-like family protein n=1 Tax=Halobacillus hunanensis TaxID=578214 RepID=UPI0009A5DC75|nr:DUF5082 family protein [Halobacillus hunanensis]
MLIDLLSYYNRLQAQKQEELQRLREAERTLDGYREEFASQQKNCLRPELAPGTWAGQLTDEFENIRINGILTQYRSIDYKQFSNVLNIINNKINTLQLDLSFYEQRINSVRYEIANPDRQ